MRCKKCGAECKDTQRYCLKCGTELHSEQESRMERELADSVGELLDSFADAAVDEDDEELEDYLVHFDTSVFDEEEEQKEEEKKAAKLHGQMQLDAIYSGSRQERDEEDWEYDEDKYFDDITRSQQTGALDELEETDGEEEFPEESVKQGRNAKNKKKKSVKKKKIIITSIVVAVVLLIFVGGGIYLMQNLHFNLTSFDDYYKIAGREYKRKDYSTALKDAESALRKAQRNYESASEEDEKSKAEEQIVKARELIHDIYEGQGKDGEEYVENMRAIVDMDDSKTKYYPILAEYYSKNKPPKVLTDFLRTVRDDNEEANKLLEKYIVPVPKADKKEGQYTEQFAVTLTCEEGDTIWYTTDGQNPSTHGVIYTEPIKITNFRTLDDTVIENGITELKAIAINESGVESKIVSISYEIVMASGEPLVTPESGYYTEYTEIKVPVPEGSKCYYTIAEGSTKPDDPDTSSTLYIASAEDLPEGTSDEEKEKFKPLEIPRGTHIMKFIIVDEYGIVSDVAVRSYTLEIPRSISLNDAEALVEKEYQVDKDIVDGEEETETKVILEGAEVVIEAKWQESVIIDNQEYYIIQASELAKKEEKTTTLSTMTYAVNSYDKKVIKEIQMEDGKYVLPEEEETTEEESTTDR